MVIPNYILDNKTACEDLLFLHSYKLPKIPLYWRRPSQKSRKRFIPFSSQICQNIKKWNNKIIAFWPKICKNCQNSNKTFTPLLLFKARRKAENLAITSLLSGLKVVKKARNLAINATLSCLKLVKKKIKSRAKRSYFLLSNSWK